MVYLTVRQSPAYHQISLEELLFPTEHTKKPYVNYNVTNTKTYELANASEKMLSSIDVSTLILKLCQFNSMTSELRKTKRSDHYTFYQIPKRSGGLRTISVPDPELMNALRILKTILETDFNALYHTCAFAYVPKRSIVSALQRHQNNNSHWFLKLDIHDFFGSITLDFAMQQLAMIFPFSEVCKNTTGAAALREAIELAFLNDGLPQGTPLSPLLTNLLMIPIDYKLSKTFREYENTNLVYTRYADDFLISSYSNFKWTEIQAMVIQVFKEFSVPFHLNKQKTRYGSNTGSGANWNLGLMLNADNEITIGRQRKRVFRSAITAYSRDKSKGVDWSLEDVQHILGEYSFFRMVEGRRADEVVASVAQKVGFDPIKQMRKDISC